MIFIPIFFLHSVYLFLGVKDLFLYICYLQGCFFSYVAIIGKMFDSAPLMFDSLYYQQGRTYLLIVSFISWIIMLNYTYQTFPALQKTDHKQRKQIMALMWSALWGSGWCNEFLSCPWHKYLSIRKFSSPHLLLNHNLRDIKISVIRYSCSCKRASFIPPQ